jgi:hypothetical protein
MVCQADKLVFMAVKILNPVAEIPLEF